MKRPKLVTRPIGPCRPLLMRSLVRFGKAYIERPDQRRDGAIDPDRITLARVDMLVPAPIGSRDQIAPRHGELFALDDRAGLAVSFDHEAHGVHCVPMRRGEFPGQDQLRPHYQVGGRAKRDLRMLTTDETPEYIFG